MGAKETKAYQVKLSSGRLLGPLTLERISALIRKKKISGLEAAKELPSGDWKKIVLFPEIVELLILELKKEDPVSEPPSSFSTESKKEEDLKPESFIKVSAGKKRTKKPPPVTERPIRSIDPPSPSSHLSDLTKTEMNHPRTEKTELLTRPLQPSVLELQLELGGAASPDRISNSYVPVETEEPLDHGVLESALGTIHSNDETLLINPTRKSKKKLSKFDFLKILFLGGVLGQTAYELFFDESKKPKLEIQLEIIRPELPSYQKDGQDSKKSAQLYVDAMGFYVKDSMQGFREAEKRLKRAVSLDKENVKALAMLASTYLNLIDVSNKNETYFNVISKLIDLSRAPGIDLSETVIADVEFLLVSHNSFAAQNRIVDYTKKHQNYGVEMYYYLALTFLERGDAASAAKYIARYPDQKAFSAKVFYLRGLIAEKLGDDTSALMEYQKSIQFNAEYAKGHLKTAALLSRQGKLKTAKKNLEFVVDHPELSSPKNLAQAYYLDSMLLQMMNKKDLAISALERATHLDPDNHDILLELYSLQAKEGESHAKVQALAKMYYYLGEGERLIAQGHHEEALTPLLQARQVNDRSYLPPLKIGDMFYHLHDLQNARLNYKLALDRASDRVEVWTKYIDSVIESYDWEEAQEAMKKFKELPAFKRGAISESSIDKAQADLLQKQGLYQAAQSYYRRAMRRASIPPSIYIAYAKSLMSSKNFTDAPFFFALALRADPLNTTAITLTANCISETQSIDAAIDYLQDEAKLSPGNQAEYLTAIAELQTKRGNWTQAQQSVEQAMRMNPTLAKPWKVQAQLYLNKEHIEKGSLDKALEAFKSYSDRNPSDPSGYLERYKIFTRKADYEKAKEELSRIYTLYPKYPELHFYLGALYAIQGNHQAASEEFRMELLNNPSSTPALLAYGRELDELGYSQAALQQFTKVMSLSPYSAEAKQSAAWANYKLKNFTAAVALLQSALQLDAGNPSLYKKLGIIQRDSGNFMGSCAAFRKYLEMEPDAPDKNDFKACFSN